MTELAVGYRRLSQDGKSLEEQAETIERYCRDEDLDLVETFSDGRYASGYTGDREEFKALLARLDEGDVDHVVVRDRARLWRDAKERIRLLLDLDDLDVKIHVVETGEIVDLEGPYALTREAAQADADDVEKRKEAERGAAEQERRAREGLPRGRPPRGLAYDDAGERLVPAEGYEEALAVIRARVLEERSWSDVVEETGVSSGTARRIVDRTEEYLEADGLQLEDVLDVDDLASRASD